MQVDHWKSTVTRLASWILKTIQNAPARCLVVIGAGSNCESGRRATGGGAVQQAADDAHLGTHNIGAESFTSQELWRLMSMEGLAVVDSYYATGPTHFWQQSEHTSHPDHFWAPAGAISSSVSCCAMRGAMRNLQEIPHALPKGHCPLLWRLRYKLHFDVPDAELEPRRDHDCMAKLLSDGGSLGLVGELERIVELQRVLGPLLSIGSVEASFYSSVTPWAATASLKKIAWPFVGVIERYVERDTASIVRMLAACYEKPSMPLIVVTRVPCGSWLS
ncbi:unnamed protein product, partial [Prorocentrum cordatum]